MTCTSKVRPKNLTVGVFCYNSVQKSILAVTYAIVATIKRETVTSDTEFPPRLIISTSNTPYTPYSKKSNCFSSTISMALAPIIVIVRRQG